MSLRSLDLNTLPQLPSLKEMALSAIKEAILSKKFQPGVIYTEASVSSKLGISRTPVREALIYLSSKGYLTFLPRKGFQLKQLTEKDVQHIDFLLARHREANKAEDPLGSIHADREFHLYLAKLTNNSYLMAALEDIRDLIDLAGIKTLEFKVRSVESIKEHRAIVGMLKAGSISGAVQKMEEHIWTTQERALARIRNSAGNPGPR
jgi:DNA-binding GntR family transcriptional regulator